MATYIANSGGQALNPYNNRWYKPAQTAVAQPAQAAANIAGAETTAPYVAPTTSTTANPEQYWKDAANLARRTSQGGWSAGLDTLKRELGGAGWKVGESGVADSSIGNYLASQSEGLGKSATELAVNAAKEKFSQNLSLDQFNEAKNQWGQEFGANREDQAFNNLMSYMTLAQQNQYAPYAAYWNSLGGAINS